MDDNSSEYRFGQEAGISYQEVLDLDNQNIPAPLRAVGGIDPGSDPIPVEHYTSAEYFQRTIPKMWMKTWQMACRLQERAAGVGFDREPGDVGHQGWGIEVHLGR